MSVTRLLGIILLVAGLFGLLYGHFDYTKETHEGQFGLDNLARFIESGM